MYAIFAVHVILTLQDGHAARPIDLYLQSYSKNNHLKMLPLSNSTIFTAGM